MRPRKFSYVCSEQSDARRMAQFPSHRIFSLKTDACHLIHLVYATIERAAATVAAAKSALILANDIEPIEPSVTATTDKQSDPSDDYQDPIAAKKRARALPIATGLVDIRKPAPIDQLPTEIRHIIIDYLEYEVHSILCLSVVSKIWYLTLASGKEGETRWHRKCLRQMKVKRRSAGCPTWFQTFVHQMNRRCSSCFDISFEEPPSHLYNQWPSIRVCEQCSLSPHAGIFQLIFPEERAGIYLLDARALAALPRSVAESVNWNGSWTAGVYKPYRHCLVYNALQIRKTIEREDASYLDICI